MFLAKGQFGAEFILVLAVLLTALAVISVPLYRSSGERVSEANDVMNAREAVSKLARKIEAVYAGV